MHASAICLQHSAPQGLLKRALLTAFICITAGYCGPVFAANHLCAVAEIPFRNTHEQNYQQSASWEFLRVSEISTQKTNKPAKLRAYGVLSTSGLWMPTHQLTPTQSSQAAC